MTHPAPRPTSGARPPLQRAAGMLLVALILALTTVLGFAPPAPAHSTLLFTSPAADATVADSPTSLVLVFDQPVGRSGSTVHLKPAAKLGTPTLSRGDRTLTIPVRSRLGEGVHTVDWQVTARDGDIMTGNYRFAVGPRTVALGAGQATAAKDATPTAVMRWLLFTALALLLGELTTKRLAAPVPSAPARRPRPWALPATLAGCAAALALAALQVGDGSPTSLLKTRPGLLALVEVAGFALAGAVVLARRRTWALVPLAAILAAEALRAHPQAQQTITGPVLTFVHLLAAALWAGALVHVLRTIRAWRGERSAARALLLAYARWAAWLFAAVAVTGLISALLLVDPTDLTASTYGRVLLGKLVLVVTAAVLALLARRRLRRTAATSHRPARAETGALAAVLALSATLTVLPVPADADRPLPFAPPVDGPVVPAGTRTGEIGISAKASTGQLVIDLTAPRVGDPDQQAYALSATLADPRGTRRALKLRGCGTGCYYAPVSWRDGTSRLTLSAAAEQWTGGRAGLTISWPPRTDTALLREAVAAMKKALAFTLHELVTSNTARGLGDLKQLPLTGKESSPPSSTAAAPPLSPPACPTRTGTGASPSPSRPNTRSSPSPSPPTGASSTRP
ncbi:copper resistance CopC family protein [Streptomyces sp. NPDC006129]|uniref:copper resistance CopC family protein n=1 Tax=Streptomyces sp. NPDC006129 TaxID=3155348 RepID=UPI0033BEAB2F